MQRFATKRLLELVPILFAAILLIFEATPAHAMPCFTDLANCYYRAAVVDSFWYRWAAGLDCELGFVRCARQDLTGF